MSGEMDVGTQFNWFWYFVDVARNAFKFNNSSFQACIGKRRSGKSVFCLAAASAVDPDFSEEKICFGIDELKQALTVNTESAIIWEEAGASAYSRDFMDERNKIISKTLQVYGYRKIALYGNFQHLKFLDGDIRLQLDCFHKLKSVNHFTEKGEPFTQAYAMPYAIVTDYIQEPLIAPYRVERDGVYQQIGQIPLPQMREFFELTGVTKSLYRNYLKKKDEYFIEIAAPEPEEEEEIFSKRELKTLTRTNLAFLNLASRLIEDEKMTRRRIAELADIPVSTLAVWLSKREDAPTMVSRVMGEETTTNFFL